MTGFSIELVPRNAASINDFREYLDEGTAVTIAWPPQLDLRDMLTAACKLRREGMEPVPHLVARRIDSEQTLTELLAALAGEAGVTRLLCLGGDPERPAGPYADAGALIQPDRFRALGIRAIAVAGHPEGHAVMDAEKSRRVLANKVQRAGQAGLEVEVISQFVLDPDTVIRWYEETFTTLGSPARLRIGIPAAVSGKRLLQLAASCGLGNSLAMLKKNGLRMARLAMQPGAGNSQVSALSQWSLNTPNVAGFHLYSFGSFEKTARWGRQHIAA